MALFAWKKEYSVGIKTMDDQHIQLIAITNDFHAVMMKGEGQSAAGPILRKLVHYIRVHFSAEEALMKEHNYPGLAELQAMHENGIRHIDEALARHERGDQTVHIVALDGMYDGIVNHILGEDMKFALWMKEHAVRERCSAQVFAPAYR